MGSPKARPTKGADWIRLGVTLRLLRSELGVGYRAFAARLGLAESWRRALEDLERGGHGVSETRLRAIVTAVGRLPLSGSATPIRGQFLAQSAALLGSRPTASLPGPAPHPVSRRGMRDRATFEFLLDAFDRLPPSEAVSFLEVLEASVLKHEPGWAGEAAVTAVGKYRASGDYAHSRIKAEAAHAAYGPELTPQMRWNLAMQSGIASAELRDYDAARRSIRRARALEREAQVDTTPLEPARHWLCRIESDRARANSWCYDSQASVQAAAGLLEVHRADEERPWHPFWAADALLDCLQFGRLDSSGQLALMRQLELAENLKKPPGTEELYLPMQRTRAAMLGVDRPRIMGRVRASSAAVVDIMDSASEHEWRTPLSYGMCLIAEIEASHGRAERAVEAIAAACALNRNQRLLLGIERSLAGWLDMADLTDAAWQRLSEAALAGEGLFRFVSSARVDEPLLGVELLRELSRRRGRLG